MSPSAFPLGLPLGLPGLIAKIEPNSIAPPRPLLAASPKRHMGLEGSDGFVTTTAAPIATGWSDPVAGWDLHPQKIHDFSRRTR